MKHHWLQKAEKDHLLIFFCGWGNDYQPFQSLPSHTYDVLCLFSYHEQETVSIAAIANTYQTVSVIAWSMGVLQAELALKESNFPIEKALAINGTLQPVSDNYGIPRRAYAMTIRSFSEKARNNFYLRMCGDRETYAQYCNNLPDRQIDEQKQELEFHQSQSDRERELKTSVFTHVLLGIDDQIFPIENMKRFWQDGPSVHIESFPHFVFYRFKSWDDIIQHC